MPRSASNETLQYVIELWREPSRKEVERTLARASSSRLAREILKAATAEFPERRVTLRKGSRILAQSG